MRTDLSGANLSDILFEGSSFFYAKFNGASNIPLSIVSSSLPPDEDNPDTELFEEITELCEDSGLLPSHEATKRIVWAIGESRDAMFQELLLRTNHCAIEEEYIELLGNVLGEAVFYNLHDVSVFDLGAGFYDIYILGQTLNDGWIGIRSGLTWT